MASFPRLQTLFASKADRYDAVAAQDPYYFARREAEALLERAEGLRVAGLNKIADDCATAGKLKNVLAEVRVGSLFAAFGARVELLRDNAFHPARFTPDLAVDLEDDQHLLVEVIQGSSGSPQLAMALKPKMDSQKLSFSVEHFIGRQLTVSGAGWQEREANESFCDSVAEKICEELSQAAARGETHGVRRILQTATGLRVDAARELYEDVPPARAGDEWIASFAFKPPWTGDASPGGGASVGRIIEDERHQPGFLRKLRGKAEKRRELPCEHQSKPFVVAVENHEMELLPQTVLSTLTGRRQQLASGLWEDLAVPQQVEEACACGWAELMKAWSYIDSPSTRLADYGVFGGGEDDWAANISAVLVSHYGGAVIQWLPNPFAASAISDARLIHLGFGLDALGAPPPEAYWGARGPHASL